MGLGEHRLQGLGGFLMAQGPRKDILRHRLQGAQPLQADVDKQCELGARPPSNGKNTCQVMIFRPYSVYNNFEMIKTGNQNREKTNNFAADCIPSYFF